MNKACSSKTRRLSVIDDIMRGSAVVMERVCGSSSCRCLRGHKHRSLYISQYHKGSPRMVYIPRENEAKALRLIKNYKALKSAINKASDLNIKRLTVPRRRGKT